MNFKSIVVCLLFVAFRISFTDNIQPGHQSGESHNTGDSFFSQRDESNLQTCEKLGTCEEKSGTHDCWGYEEGCTSPEKWFTKPHCDDSMPHRHFNTHEDKIYQFWKDTDFGYVRSVQDSLQFVCKPKENKADSSSLVCSKQLTYCKAKNLYMDFRDSAGKEQDSSKSNVFKPQQIGGFCEVDSNTLTGDGVYRMELSSWLNEVEDFSPLPFQPNQEEHCDILVEKPTFFMKLDAVVNMYHHFCDFFNLYATQHVNGSFDTDVNIVLWEKYPRRSLGNFGATWRAFTSNPVLYLGGQEYKNKRLTDTAHNKLKFNHRKLNFTDHDGQQYGYRMVCFKQAIFALLPRMVFGLFYNTPLIPGCSKSGLFKAFSEHLMNRLGITQEKNVQNSSEPIRVTLLSRGTKFRKILNEEEIIEALKTYPGVNLMVSQYSWDVPFLDQVKNSHNTDIFIGMHGAGLTHALFLPDWALLFELYNCGDTNCYRDLGRLRGISYITWENQDKVSEKTEELHPEYKDHPKFRNYAFDVREFMRLVEQAVVKVRRSIKEYRKQIKR